MSCTALAFRGILGVRSFDDHKNLKSRKSRGLSTAQSTMAHLMTGFGIGLVWYLSGDTSMDSVKDTLKSLTTPTPYVPNTVTYERMDVEIAAKDSIYEGFPEHDVRLRLDSYVPAIIMIGSFVLFWFASSCRLFFLCSNRVPMPAR